MDIAPSAADRVGLQGVPKTSNCHSCWLLKSVHPPVTGSATDREAVEELHISHPAREFIGGIHHPGTNNRIPAPTEQKNEKANVMLVLESTTITH